MQSTDNIQVVKLPIVLILALSLTCLTCKRSVPDQGNPVKAATNQLVRIDEPVCGPSRGSIIKGNVYLSVDVLPEFPGGESKMREYIETHIKYPANAHGAAGRVNVTFVINRNGSLSDIEAVGRKMHPSLEKEALRIVRASPKWKPGKLKGKKVRVQYTVPIVFLPQQAPPNYHRPG